MRNSRGKRISEFDNVLGCSPCEWIEPDESDAKLRMRFRIEPMLVRERALRELT